MEYYLLIDIGTGSTRAALTDSSGRIIGMHSVENAYVRDEAYPDAQYFIPADWERAIFACCDALRAEHPDIAACAVSAAGTRQTLLLLDAEGRAYYGLPNIDNRGREFMGEMAGLEDELYRLAGKWVTEDVCAAKLLGLKRRRGDIYARAAKVVSASEWIAGLFTGRTLMEPTMAC